MNIKSQAITWKNEKLLGYMQGFPGGQRLKSLTPMRETWVQFLGWEEPLETEMATHSSTLAWKIPWTEKHSRLQSLGPQRVGLDMNKQLNFHFIII